MLVQTYTAVIAWVLCRNIMIDVPRIDQSKWIELIDRSLVFQCALVTPLSSEY